MSKNELPRTILITGGAGFVGSSIGLHLRKLWPGCTVIALDNLKRRGSELNLPRLKTAGIRFIHGDVRERSDLDNLPRIDVLIECSAEPSVQAGYQGAADYVVDTNLVGTLNCMRLAARDKADVLFLSTSRVYPITTINALCMAGPHGFAIDPEKTSMGVSNRGIGENLPLAGARTLYGATKLASEVMVQEYAAMHGFRSVIDRCGVLAGPWQMGKVDQGFVLLWLSRHYWGLPLNYIGFGGQGAQVRDVLHVADLCDLVVHQLQHFGELDGRVFNVGGGLANSASLHAFTQLCAEVTGRTTTIGTEANDRPGDLKLYITDNSAVTEATGWSPKRDLRAVLHDSYTWLKEHEAELRPILE